MILLYFMDVIIIAWITNNEVKMYEPVCSLQHKCDTSHFTTIGTMNENFEQYKFSLRVRRIFTVIAGKWYRWFIAKRKFCSRQNFLSFSANWKLMCTVQHNFLLQMHEIFTMNAGVWHHCIMGFFLPNWKLLIVKNNYRSHSYYKSKQKAYQHYPTVSFTL